MNSEGQNLVAGSHLLTPCHPFGSIERYMLRDSMDSVAIHNINLDIYYENFTEYFSCGLFDYSRLR